MRILAVRAGKNAWVGTRVDDDIYIWAVRHAWRLFGLGYVGRKVYSHVEDGRPKYKTIYLHRVIAQPNEDEQVDHVNRDCLDNRRVNLRCCTSSQNLRNRPAKVGSSSHHKGVRRAHVSTGMVSRPWQVEISVGGRPKHLGYFATEIEAAVAYNAAALEIAGEFALLNDVGGS